MPTGASNGVNQAVLQGVSSLKGFVFGPFIVSIFVLIVVGIALKSGLRMLHRHGLGVGGLTPAQADYMEAHDPWTNGEMDSYVGEHANGDAWDASDWRDHSEGLL